MERGHIENALDELISFLGIKELVDQAHLASLIQSKRVKECAKEIALQLGLPVAIDMTLVPKGFRPGKNDGFQSSHLVKTDSQGRGREGIVAQVSIPPDLPLFGTSRMVDFPIRVRVGEDCYDHPETLIAVMAHELSHILLHSLMHKERESEFYTDLTPMVLGFAAIVRSGRKVVTESYSNSDPFSRSTTTRTETTTYGYLTDDNFDFVFSRVVSALAAHEAPKKALIGRACVLKTKLSGADNLFTYLVKCLEHLDKKLGSKMTFADAQRISAFHQLGYMEDYRARITKYREKVDTIASGLSSIRHYTPANSERIGLFESPLESAAQGVIELVNSLKMDTAVAEKHIGFFRRVRLKRALRRNTP
jgi:hypothetical protein